MLNTAIQQCSTCSHVPGREKVSRWAGAAFTAVSKDDGDVTIRIVDREEGAELNRRYRNGSRETNVLSFDYANDPHAPPGQLGDIVICAPVVGDEASAQSKSVEAHWAHMVVHGVLHLCGYDHQHDAAAAEMEALEAQVLKALGYPAPYG